jgi:hypothetical protein
VSKKIIIKVDLNFYQVQIYNRTGRNLITGAKNHKKGHPARLIHRQHI